MISNTITDTLNKLFTKSCDLTVTIDRGLYANRKEQNILLSSTTKAHLPTENSRRQTTLGKRTINH